MSDLAIEAWLRFLAWLAVGMVLYVGYGRRNARLAQGPVHEQASPAQQHP